MKEYMRLTTACRQSDANRYLREGWEIIEMVKTNEKDEDRQFIYHLGLPAKALAKQLLKVIRTYEKHGFKTKLMETVAELNGEDVSNYRFQSGKARFNYEKTKTTRFIEEYEWFVNQEEVQVGVISKQDREKEERDKLIEQRLKEVGL